MTWALFAQDVFLRNGLRCISTQFVLAGSRYLCQFASAFHVLRTFASGGSLCGHIKLVHNYQLTSLRYSLSFDSTHQNRAFVRPLNTRSGYAL